MAASLYLAVSMFQAPLDLALGLSEVSAVGLAGRWGLWHLCDHLPALTSDVTPCRPGCVLCTQQQGSCGSAATVSLMGHGAVFSP